MPVHPSLTQRAREGFQLAHNLADQRGDPALTSTHLALGILEEGQSIPVYLLHSRGVPLDALARDLEAALPAPAGTRSQLAQRQWAREDDAFVEQASREAQELGTVYYGCEHLFLALLRDRTSTPARVLASYGVTYEEAREVVRSIHAAQPGSSPPWKTVSRTTSPRV